MEVKAKLNNFRKSPRKVRLAADVIRGLDAEEAQNQLKFLIKGSAPDFEKLLGSAIANAENNFGLDKNNLFIKDIIVNEGASLKRWLPRAHGRASLILKKTSNIEIVLAEKIEGKGRKKVQKQEIKEMKLDELKKEKERAEAVREKKPARIATRSVASGEKAKERDEKEFLDEKKKVSESKGFLRKIFRRKSI